MSDEMKSELIALTADITSSYLSHNKVESAELPMLIRAVHAALSGIKDPVAAPKAARAPAVPIRKSVADDHIVCLEDGRKFKSLKRHLRTKYNLTPDEYRAKWGLPKSYPMVAPSYAKARSDLAKQLGLGQGLRPSGKAPAARRAKVVAAG